METISERFDYARKQKGLSYRELGELFEITGDAVRKSIERNNLKNNYINTFSDKYGINKKWLLTGNGDKYELKEPGESYGLDYKELYLREKEIVDILKKQIIDLELQLGIKRNAG